MTEQSNRLGGLRGIIDRVPQLLFRVIIVVTIIYILGFLWTFTGGTLGRLFIPFQWDLFFTERSAAETLGGHWFLYGTSFAGLFTNWLILLALITGAYYAYVFITQRKKQ